MTIKRQSAAIAAAMTTHESLSTRQPSSGTAQLPHSPQKARAVYFHLSVYDASNADEPVLVEELQAGKTYLLAITCETHRSLMNKKLKQERCAIIDTFALSLAYNYDISVTTPITPAKVRLPFDSFFGDQQTYELTLPAAFPTCHLSIRLELKTPQRPLPVEILNYTLPVCGQQKAPVIEILTISQINQHLPEETAILLVEIVQKQAIHKQRIRLRGWSGTGQQLDDTAAMKMIISIEELQSYRQKKAEQEFSPDEILKRLTYFSRHNSRKLLRWLNGLFVSYQEQLNLIIVDLTETEIPWEMLEFERDLYLGACARVVRWLPTQYFLRERKLSIEPDSHAGSVISYLDKRFNPDLIQDEREALNSLAGKPYASLSALRKRLEVSLEEVGLIYIGCHGKAGKHLLQQNVPELSSIMLEGIYECKTPRLTVFLNACESARTIKKSPDDVSNFVDAFLAYCASGFIGTLARVDILTASQIAGRILRSALQGDGVQIAETLRLLRQTEIEQLQRLKQQNIPIQSGDLYRIIDTFMYVYYGNPLARLQLHYRKESEE